MSVEIKISSYCRCGGELVVSSSDPTTVLGIADMFDQVHTGDGHARYPTKGEAKQAAREAAS